jgi:hypothetical protein
VPPHLLPNVPTGERRARRLALLLDSDDQDIRDWAQAEYLKLGRAGRRLVREGVFEVRVALDGADDNHAAEDWSANENEEVLEKLKEKLEREKERLEEREEVEREMVWAREVFGKWLVDGRLDAVFRLSADVLNELLKEVAADEGIEWGVAEQVLRTWCFPASRSQRRARLRRSTSLDSEGSKRMLTRMDHVDHVHTKLLLVNSREWEPYLSDLTKRQCTQILQSKVHAASVRGAKGWFVSSIQQERNTSMILATASQIAKGQRRGTRGHSDAGRTKAFPRYHWYPCSSPGSFCAALPAGGAALGDLFAVVE